MTRIHKIGKTGIWITMLILASIIGLMTPSTAAAASVVIRIAGAELACSPAPFMSQGQLYAPASSLSKALGIALKPAGDTFSVSGSESRVRRLTRNSTDFASVSDAAEAANCSLVSDEKTADIMARVTGLRFSEGKILISATLPVRSVTKRLSNPERVYVDLLNTRLDGPAGASKSAFSVVRELRIAQFDPTTVRVVAETVGKVEYKDPGTGRHKEICVEISSAGGVPDSKTADARNETASKDATFTETNAYKPSAQPALTTIKEARVLVTDDRIRVVMKADGKPAVTSRADYLEGLVSTDFANTVVDARERHWRIESPLASEVTLASLNETAPMAVLTAKTSRVLLSRITKGSSADEIVWELFPPRNAEGDFRGKTIIIDAGHGGHDTGASGNGLLEKDIVLKIARAAQIDASQRGLKVVMTREDDTFRTLRSRTEQIALAGASIFVSIHANSNRRPGSASGTEVYYHKNDTNSKALAQVVHDSIVTQTGMKARGAMSDTRLYSIGLFVLRNSTVPAILVEIGYVNHSGDAKRMSAPEFQRKAARAIVDGVMRYLGGSPQMDSDLAGDSTNNPDA